MVNRLEADAGSESADGVPDSLAGAGITADAELSSLDWVSVESIGDSDVSSPGFVAVQTIGDSDVSPADWPSVEMTGDSGLWSAD
jgi:hypothetical protein